MPWFVHFRDEFAEEFRSWRPDVQKAAATSIATLQLLGPTLARPHADTLKVSRHGNMKELRFSVCDGEWRIAFAFDPSRQAILLLAESKSGLASDLLYLRPSARADK